MAKELRVKYMNKCGGINSMVSPHLTTEDEVWHSVNTDSETIGTLQKCAGQAEYWDLGAARDVLALKQVGSNYYAVLKTAGGADAELYKKGTGSAVDTDVALDTTLEAGLGYLFYKLDDDSMASYDGTTAGTEHLKNAPDGDIIKSAMNRLFIIDGDKVYFSSYPRSIVATIVGDHTGTYTTINVSSTEYLRAGDSIDIHPINNGTKRGTVTVLAVTGLNTFTVSATPGYDLSNGDEIYWNGDRGVDTYMWNDDLVNGSWFYCTSDDGDVVAAEEQLGTLLLVKAQSVWRYSETRLDKISDFGTEQAKTLKTVGKEAFFANKNGIYIVTNNDVFEVSRKIKKYFDGISDPTVMVAGVDGDKYRLYIGDTSYKNLTDVEIVLDTNNNRYEIRSGNEATAYGNFIVSNVLGTYIAASTGVVSTMKSGTDNNGSDIGMYVEMGEDSFDRPDIKKLIDRIIFYTTPGSVMDVLVSLDSGEWKTVGQIDKPVQSFEIGERCNNINIALSESSSDTSPGIYGYEIIGFYDEEE